MSDAILILQKLHETAVNNNYPYDFKKAIEKCIQALKNKEEGK